MSEAMRSTKMKSLDPVLRSHAESGMSVPIMAMRLNVVLVLMRTMPDVQSSGARDQPA